MIGITCFDHASFAGNTLIRFECPQSIKSAQVLPLASEGAMEEKKKAERKRNEEKLSHQGENACRSIVEDVGL